MDDYTYINDKPLNLFSALLLSSYGVGQSSVAFDTLVSSSGAGFVVAGRTLGLRTITLPLHVYGETPEETQQHVSRLLEEFIDGKVKIGLPDGFLYFGVLTGQEGPDFITEELVSLTLTLQGIRCKPLETVTGNELSVYGTLPEMDCVIRATVGKSAQTYTVAGIVFDGGAHTSGLSAGDQIVIDGINKIVTINGDPAMDRCSLVTFPTLHPGENIITALDPVTVEYYPMYL